MMQPFRILIADSHAIVRQGLSQICNAEPDMCVVGQAVDGPEAYQMALQLQPDMMIIDINLPMLDSVQLTRRLIQALPGVGILLLTTHRQDQPIFEAIKAGARAYLLKDADSDLLLQTIRTVASGEAVMNPVLALKILETFLQQQHDLVLSRGIIFLNQRDMDILRLFAQGLDTSAVSQRLCLLETTVRDRMTVILEKLHVSNTVQAVPDMLNMPEVVSCGTVRNS
jgi:two-component system, NarL family, response regulator LiaR